MSRIVNKLLSTTGGVAVETDEFFNQTTLLLHGDGTNGSQNNTFLDSSSNNFTITRNGNTTQGSYSPYGDRWSNYFDGTGDNFEAAPSGTLEITSSTDFCFETWVYATDLGASMGIMQAGRDSGSLGLRINPNGTIQVIVSGVSAETLSVSSLTENEWVHIAVSRDNGTLRFFFNGVLDVSDTDTINYADITSSNPFVVGSRYFSGAIQQEFIGYLADFRFVIGSPVHTSNFTPPTEPLTAVSGTSLLTCQSNRFKDNSSNDFAITVNGDTKVTPFSPYAPSAAYDPATHGGSGYFDGTGDYISGAADASLALSGAFTLETWFYPNSFDQVNSIGDTIFSTTTSGGVDFGRTSSSQGNEWGIAEAGVIWQLTTTTLPTNNQWNHMVASRDASNNTALFLNGSRVASGTVSTSFAQNGFSIGSANGATSTFLDGYLSDFRVVNGTAVYDPTATTITVPTAPLTAVTNTSLLCNFTNAGIFDSTGKNVLETVGNAQIDTAVTKFGTGSIEFDGTGDYLVMENSGSLNLAGVSWTIEAWLNPSSNFSTARIVFAKRLSGSSTLSYQGYLDVSTGNISFSNGSSTYVSSSAPTANTWNHCAWVYDGANINIYLNGTSVLSSATTITEVDTELVIGAIRGFSSGAYLGYIDDLRITKGVARYTANFTPPTKAFPDQ